MTRARRSLPASALRYRLVASLFAASLVPFAAAWWIANGYAVTQARERVDTRLEYAVRIGVARFEDALAGARERARSVAADRDVQRAMLRGDPEQLRLLLRPRELITLGDGDGLRVGGVPRGVPAARIVMRSNGRPVGRITVAIPAVRKLLAQGALAAGGIDELALARGGRIVAGPPALAGATLEGNRVRADGDLRTSSAGVPGFDPPAILLALANEDEIDAAVGALRMRLAVAGLFSLGAIALLAAALARPLLRGLGKVESAAEQAEIDPLTGLANRRGFERVLAAELERCSRFGHTCALVLADLDDFKHVNDAHGHAAGDLVLRAFADVLRACTRTIDVAARPGGEEFALLLAEATGEGARHNAERIRSLLAERVVRTAAGATIQLTASFGVAEGRAGITPAELVRTADEALYAAKREGKNRVAGPPTMPTSAA